MKSISTIPVFGILLTIVGCSTDSEHLQIRDGAPQAASIPANIAAIPDAVPRLEPRTRAGNPPSYRINGKSYTTLTSSKNYKQRGIASWYGTKFHGRKTANGETYDMYAMTAAHKTLPIPSYVRVTNLRNKRSVIVRINDRGPFHAGRIIDLSYAAAVKLGIQQTGTGYVEVQALDPKPQARLQPAGSEDKLLVYLQVGTFSNPFNAREMLDRINARVQPQSRILSETGQGGALYRVQLGPVDSLAEARRMARQLTEIGIAETRFVVQKAAHEN